MKQLTLTLALLCAACALTFAGPEPMRSSGKEIVQQPVVETSCFEGWYFGIHGGGLLSNSNSDTTAAEDSLGARGNGPVSVFDRANGDDNGGSVPGGLHLGYNWQRGGWIFGVEADLSATALDQHEKAAAIFNNLGASEGGTDLLYVTEVNSQSTVD